MSQILRGKYRDIIVTSKGRVQWDSGWHCNLIVEQCRVLLAALMKGDEEMDGILYCAVGAGEKDWDSQRPIPPLTTAQLTNEVYRMPVSAEQITYLDETDQPSEIPTGRLEITIEFHGEDMVSNGYQSLREFGLFGGNATEEVNSGLMIDYIIHPRIDLIPSTELRRSVRLTFMAGAREREELGNLGASLPVIRLDGVGREYADALNREGIHSLGDLVMVDPQCALRNISQGKLREFWAKAGLVMKRRAYLTPFILLADRNIGTLLRDTPEESARAGGSSDVTPEMVRHLQEELAVLQVCLDDAYLQRITLGELINEL